VVICGEEGVAVVIQQDWEGKLGMCVDSEICTCTCIVMCWMDVVT
jgi:hypothetical protein